MRLSEGTDISVLMISPVKATWLLTEDDLREALVWFGAKSGAVGGARAEARCEWVAQAPQTHNMTSHSF